jgi:hypothetical protein
MSDTEFTYPYLARKYATEATAEITDCDSDPIYVGPAMTIGHVNLCVLNLGPARVDVDDEAYAILSPWAARALAKELKRAARLAEAQA